MFTNGWGLACGVFVGAAVSSGCGGSDNGSGGSSTGSQGTAQTGSASGSATTSTSTGSGGGSSLPVVFMVVLENHDWSSIKGSASAPYLNTTLLPMGAHAEQYTNLPGIHPSLPNYLWLEAGENFGILDDNGVNTNAQATTAHLVTQLEAAGLDWKSYQEDIDGTKCPLSSVKKYAPRHNPVVFFKDVTNNNDPMAPRCIKHVRPYGELATDLAQNHVAQYNFITPNLCNDGHDVCPPQNDAVKQIDDWLSTQVPTILASQAYQDRGVLIITFDESENGNNAIGFIVLSKYGKGGGYSNTIPYTHSSTVRTLQEMFKLSPFLGGAQNATDLSDLFTALP